MSSENVSTLESVGVIQQCLDDLKSTFSEALDLSRTSPESDLIVDAMNAVDSLNEEFQMEKGRALRHSAWRLEKS